MALFSAPSSVRIHGVSTPYHRLARETPQYAWWKLPVAGFLTAVLYFFAVLALMLAAVVVIYAFGHDGDKVIDAWSDTSYVDAEKPGFFALDMIMIALMIPAVLIAVLITGPDLLATYIRSQVDCDGGGSAIRPCWRRLSSAAGSARWWRSHM